MGCEIILELLFYVLIETSVVPLRVSILDFKKTQRLDKLSSCDKEDLYSNFSFLQYLIVAVEAQFSF